MSKPALAFVPEHAPTQAASSVTRVWVPGTLCDARLFEPLLAHAATHSAAQSLQYPAPANMVLSLAQLRQTDTWWHAQLARLPAQFDLIGFSLGGIAGLALLQLAPQRVRRFVLVSSSADAAGESQRSRSEQQLRDWQNSGARALIQTQVSAITPAGQLSADALLRLQDMAHDTPFASLQAQAELNAGRSSGYAALQAWGGPLLLICGEADPWCGPTVQARIQAHRPDALLHTLAGASHYTVLEQPHAVALAINSFLTT